MKKIAELTDGRCGCVPDETLWLLVGAENENDGTAYSQTMLLVKRGSSYLYEVLDGNDAPVSAGVLKRDRMPVKGILDYASVRFGEPEDGAPVREYAAAVEAVRKIGSAAEHVAFLGSGPGAAEIFHRNARVSGAYVVVRAPFPSDDGYGRYSVVRTSDWKVMASFTQASEAHDIMEAMNLEAFEEEA